MKKNTFHYYLQRTWGSSV